MDQVIKQYKVDLLIPDDIWEKIKPIGKQEGSGLLCGACIMEKIESMSDYACFSLITKEDV